jgi:hypothetical protein
MKAILGSALLAALLPDGGPPQGVEFRLQYLAVHGRRIDSLNYDFDGDGKPDVLNTSIDYDATPPTRWFAIHFQKDGVFPEKPDVIRSIDPRGCALVFGDYLPGGGVEVGFLAEDGVWIHPPERGRPGLEPVKLIHARTFFRSAPDRNLPVWSWAMDLDGNGTHDLILPLADGYRVFFQTAPGTFGRTAHLEADLDAAAPRSLAPSGHAAGSELLAAHFTSTLELPRVQPVDINGDGLPDFVTIRGDTITYFLQKEPGVFPSRRPWRFSFAVPALKEEAKKDTVSLTLIKFTDIDRDKLADLVVTRIEGTLGLWDSIRTSIYIHMGTGRGNFVADRKISIDGVSIDPEFIDMDLDGKLDAVTSRLRTDLMKKAVEAFVLGDVAISYEVFQFDPAAKTFFADPVFEKQLFIRRADIEKTGAGSVPLVFIRGDLSGDGRPDLVHIEPKTQELLIHPGVVRETGRGRRIGFDGTAHWRVTIERHPKGIQILDANGDGVNDIILYHAGALGLVLSRK